MLSSIGPTEIILLLMIIVIVLLYYFAYRWSSNKSGKAALGKPLKWFYFYTYIRMPLSILYGIGILIRATTASEVVVCLIIIGFQVANIIGLSKFRLWGLNLNIILLFAESVFYSLSIEDDPSSGSFGLTTRLIIRLIFWFLPNIVYFEKRRKLFGTD